MSERPDSQSENPLEDLAAALSEGLGNKPVEFQSASTDEVRGGQVRMTQSAARTVSASALHMDESAAAVVRTGSLDAHDSNVAVAIARQATLSHVNSSLIVAQRVDAKDVRAVFVVGGGIRGDVRSVFTPLSAAALGAGFAIVLRLLQLAVARKGRPGARSRSAKAKPA